MKNVFVLAFAIVLTGCAVSPYAKGRSAADIPTNVDVVAVRQVAMAYGTDKNGDPLPDPKPSANDQEVTVMVKRNIMSQLTNYGYKLVEDGNALADVGLRFYIYYQPERWPLVSRVANVIAIIDDENGVTLYKTSALEYNNSGLIGALAGPSRDQMVSAAARQAVINVVTELRKGTKENIPVAAKPVAVPVQEAPAKPLPLQPENLLKEPVAAFQPATSSMPTGAKALVPVMTPPTPPPPPPPKPATR